MSALLGVVVGVTRWASGIPSEQRAPTALSGRPPRAPARYGCGGTASTWSKGCSGAPRSDRWTRYSAPRRAGDSTGTRVAMSSSSFTVSASAPAWRPDRYLGEGRWYCGAVVVPLPLGYVDPGELVDGHLEEREHRVEAHGRGTPVVSGGSASQSGSSISSCGLHHTTGSFACWKNATRGPPHAPRRLGEVRRYAGEAHLRAALVDRLPLR